MRQRTLGLSIPLLLAATAPLFGAVREIDQTCVLTGCFPGDGSGFPVTIALPGEYRLTSNLDTRFSASPENLTAIQVLPEAGGVDIDLNGFEVRGPVTCGQSSGACSPEGFGIGVSGSSGTTVRDGTVRGFGATGVSLSAAGRVERIRAWDNGGVGIYALGEGSVVVDSLAFRNGDDGIHTYRYGVVRDSTTAWNGEDGVMGSQRSLVDETVAWANGRVGFWADTESQVRLSVATQNGNGGLSGFAIASVGSANGTYGITRGFAWSSTALQCVLSGNAGAPMATQVNTLGQNACDGGNC